MEFGVWGLGFEVWSSGVTSWGSGFGVWSLGVTGWGMGFGVAPNPKPLSTATPNPCRPSTLEGGPASCAAEAVEQGGNNLNGLQDFRTENHSKRLSN